MKCKEISSYDEVDDETRAFALDLVKLIEKHVNDETRESVMSTFLSTALCNILAYFPDRALEIITESLELAKKYKDKKPSS